MGSQQHTAPSELLTASPTLCSDDGEALGGNPMVAGFQDDVDIEDQPHGKSLLPSDPIPSKDISLSSEEEAEGLAGHPQQCSEPETKWYGLGFPEYGQLRWQPRVASELLTFLLM